MRLLGHTLTAASVAAFSLLVAPACADNDQSIFIRQIQSPASADRGEGGGCSFVADPLAPALGEGVIDAVVRDSYTVTMLLGNQLLTRADPLQPRTEPNRARVEGAIVRVTDANDTTIGEFTSTSAGFVDPSTGVLPGFGVAFATIIDAPTLARAVSGLGPGQSRLVIAKIRAFGRTLGGVDLESDEFDFPVRVCIGCLVAFNADDPVTPGLDCSAALDGGQTNTVPCRVGQDEGTSCRLCSDRAGCLARPCANNDDCSDQFQCLEPRTGQGPAGLRVCRLP